MIRIRVNKRQGSYREFVSSGHADYADEGEDIVCAAVSALIISTVNALEAFAGNRAVSEERDGYVRIILPEENNEKEKLLMDALVLGLTGIAGNYGHFIKVKIREA